MDLGVFSSRLDDWNKHDLSKISSGRNCSNNSSKFNDKKYSSGYSSNLTSNYKIGSSGYSSNFNSRQSRAWTKFSPGRNHQQQYHANNSGQNRGYSRYR